MLGMMEERGGREGKGRVPSTLPPCGVEKTTRGSKRIGLVKGNIWSIHASSPKHPSPKRNVLEIVLCGMYQNEGYFFFFMEKIKHVTRAPRSEKRYNGPTLADKRIY